MASLSETVKNLRKELALTRAQLADMLGVAGNSIYRWESGRSRPDLEGLQSLYSFAKKHNSAHAAGELLEILADRMPQLKDVILQSSRRKQQQLNAKIERLPHRQQEQIAAFIKLLQHGSDKDQQIADALIKQWMDGQRSD